MSDDWKLKTVDDEECPVPDEFWHIEFIDSTYDRISVEEANKLIATINEGKDTWAWIETISESNVYIRLDYIMFIGKNTKEIRELDRKHTRWFAYEAKSDPYLKQVNDDD